MKNAHPQTGKWLRELFPEQTKSVGSIVCWTVVFLLDALLVFWLADRLGIHIFAMNHQYRKVLMMVYLVIALAVFWLETAVCNRIAAAIRKSRELD